MHLLDKSTHTVFQSFGNLSVIAHPDIALVYCRCFVGCASVNCVCVRCKFGVITLCAPWFVDWDCLCASTLRPNVAYGRECFESKSGSCVPKLLSLPAYAMFYTYAQRLLRVAIYSVGLCGKSRPSGTHQQPRIWRPVTLSPVR